MLKLLIFIRDKFGLTDKLTLYRHIGISVYCWFVTIFLLSGLGETFLTITNFIFTTILSSIFLIISKGKTEKSWLLDKISWLFQNKKLPILVSLFFLEPFLFIVFYGNNYFGKSMLSSKNPWQKFLLRVFYWTLLLVSLLIASFVWAWFVETCIPLIKIGIVYFFSGFWCYINLFIF